MKGLRESRDSTELRKIVDYLGIVAFVIDVEGNENFRIAAINERNEQLSGMRLHDVAGRLVDEVLTPEMARRVKDKYRDCVQQRTVIEYRESLDLPAGTAYWQTTLVPYLDDAGNVYRLLGTSIDITSTIQLEHESGYQSTLLNAYLDESTDGILVVDANNHMKTWNQRFLEIWDIPEAIMEAGDGAGALDVVRSQLKQPDDFIERVMNLYDHLDQEEQGYRFEMLDGRVFERYSRGLRDPQETYWGRIWFYRDITEYERMTEELQRLARTDVLTDTSNRRAFMEVLTEEYLRAQRYEHPLTVMMIDLDQFKSINDRYGHDGGDSALRAFADVVRPLLRETDHFARMGGEEFAIVLPETDINEGCRIAERLRMAVANATMKSSRGSFEITISVGVTEMLAKDSNAEVTLNRADRALYMAKDGGRNRIQSLAQ
jgi:diguanylate cyclase (GGDEF)-like protein/PAS domain S-box-containing protein